MRPTLYLFQHTARITLFTRANCSLCEDARNVLGTLDKKRSFEYNEVDVMSSEKKNWKDLYEFDTPVVCVIGYEEDMRIFVDAWTDSRRAGFPYVFKAKHNHGGSEADAPVYGRAGHRAYR